MLARKTEHLKTQKIAFVKALLCNSKGSQQGLSMLECLAAIVVVAAVISAITPPIMLSVATRVQSRRAEQARQLAQAKVDEVRRLVETGNYTKDDLDKIAPAKVSGKNKVCNATIPFDKDKQTVDIDKGVDNPNNPNNQNKPDFWVQAFRNEGVIDPITNRPVAFDLGVRVYRYNEDENKNPITPTEIKRAAIGFTTATGSQRNKPLITLYSRVVLSDTQNSQKNYNDLINANKDPSCPQ